MKARNMVQVALFAALLAACAWISIPAGDIAFTLQTFGVALALLLLGGKQGTLAVLIYLLLGAAGLPVFSGFRGGAGMLLGTTGGYLTGFLLIGIVYWLVTKLGGKPLIALILGQLLCYGFGSVWYSLLYAGSSTMGLGLIVLKCVVPYLLPDALKLTLAFLLAKRLSRFVY